MTRVWRALGAGEKALAIAAISAMSLLPMVEMVARLLGLAAGGIGKLAEQQRSLIRMNFAGKDR